MPTLEFFVGIFLLFLFSSFYYGILAAIGIPMACWLTGDGLGHTYRDGMDWFFWTCA